MKQWNKRKLMAVILTALWSFTLLSACAPETTGSSTGGQTSTGESGSHESTGESSVSESESVSSNPTSSQTSETTSPGDTEETTSAAEPVETGDFHEAGDLVFEDYADYSSEALNWWYRRPSELGMENRDTVDPGIKAMIDPFRAIYQDPSGERNLYLTFDAGYEHKANTAAVLDVLLEKNVKAAFFITGAYMDSSPDVVKRMVNEGHLVANHTMHHLDPVLTLAEQGIEAMAMDVEANAKKFEQLTSVPMPKYIRPGQGAYSEQVLAIYADMGYRTVFWDFAYRDWFVDDQPDPAQSLAQLKGELHPGSVILLHAVSDTNVAILGDFIDYAVDDGYAFLTLLEYP